MDCTVAAVVSEGYTVRQAALQYGVPKSSLGYRRSGRVKPGSVSVPPKYLSSGEELELVTFLSQRDSIGYAKSRKEVLALVQWILDSKGIEQTVSNGWWESFCRRQPTLTLCTATPLSIAQAKASDPEMLSRYFDPLEQTLEDNTLVGKPGRIFTIWMKRGCHLTQIPKSSCGERWHCLRHGVGEQVPGGCCGVDQCCWFLPSANGHLGS